MPGRRHGFLKDFPFSMNLQQMVPLQPWLMPCRKLYTHQIVWIFHHSWKLQRRRHLVFSLTVVGRRVLPLEGGRGESMIIVGCRLKGRPNNLQCFDFCRPKKGCRSEIPNSKKMIKGQENHFADWIISFGLKGGALYICSEVCFPAHSFARVWR